MPVKRPISRHISSLVISRLGRIPTLGLLIVLVVAGLAYPASPSLIKVVQRLVPGLSTALVSAHPMQSGCTVNCGATAPATAEINQTASFTSTAAPAGCVGQPTYQWDFGDNTGSGLQNPTHVYTTGGIYNWRLTVEALSASTTNITTVAGGGGEGDAALDVPFARLLALTRDPQGRGIYVVSAPPSNESSGARIVFINTGTTVATIGGIQIVPGTVRTIAGGGTQSGENQPSLNVDLGTTTGLATNPAGDLVYYTDQTGNRIRVLNVSAAPVAVAGVPLAVGAVRTLARPVVMGVPVFGDNLYGLAYQPSTNDLIVADATPSANKVFRAHQDGTVEVVAGNGQSTRPDAVFEPAKGPLVPLLDPRAVEVDLSGNILIADAGHARIIRVLANGDTFLFTQYSQARGTDGALPLGIAISNSVVYSANANDQQVLRATGAHAPLAGQYQIACDYSASNCGDGDASVSSSLGFPYSTGDYSVIGIEGEATGVYVVDQTTFQRGRIRYINTSASSVTRAGVTIPANGIATIAGRGVPWPYDGAKGTGASLQHPVGVAADANRNLFISDTQHSRIRFLNRSGTTVTLFQGTASAQPVAPGTIVTVNYVGGSNPSDTVAARFASFDHPQGLTVTTSGVYVVDTKLGPFIPPTFQGRDTSFVRFINTSAVQVTLFPGAAAPIIVPPGFAATIAGDDNPEGSGASGDGGFARKARFYGLSDVAVDGNGNLYLAEAASSTVRRIDGSTGVVTSLSLGAGVFTGVGFGPDGRLFITDAMGGRLLRQNTPGGAAFSQLASGLGSPRDVAVGADGVAIVTSAASHQLLAVATSGTVSILAGTTQGFSGDGGAATAAKMDISPPTVAIGNSGASPTLQTVGVTVTATGETFFADVNNGRIRRLGPDIIACVKTGTLSVNNPVPTLSSISPNNGPTEGPTFTLNLGGVNFVGNSVVRWNGSARQTTFVDGTHLTAQIPSTDLQTAGTASVRVFNPSPAGGQSASLTFSINNPVPAVNSISPNTIAAGTGGLTLELEGTNFINTSVVKWNGSTRTTTYVSPTLLSIEVPPTDLANAGTNNVTVTNPAPGGGTSGAAVFTVTNPVPALAVSIPNTTQGGGPAFTLTVAGTNFVPASIVRWDGQARSTMFVSSTELKADITAANIAAGGERSITVFNPAPGGGVSNPISFQVTSPAPAITSLTPSSIPAGGNGFVMTVSGSNFSSTSTVKWADQDRPTVFVDSSTLTATIAATDVAAPGTPQITVSSPPPGGGVSNAVTFTISNPVPVLTSLDPDRIVAGSSDILITVNGSKFVSNSVVRWNGQNRATTVVSATQLKVVFLSGDVANVGQGLVTVFNPAPEGGVSSALPFTIFPPNPSPSITALGTTIKVAGSGDFTLNVQGADFISSSLVYWNGTPRATTFVNSGQLSAAIPASDLTTPGVAQVSVFTPAPGGGTTNPLAFTIAIPFAVVTAASFEPGPLAPGSIVAGFGSHIAVDTAVAATQPLPTLLVGTSIQVRDSAGASRQCPLFFVSPGQANFIIPDLTAPGLGIVTVTSGDGVISLGTVQVVPFAFSLFTASSDGKGVAAANVVRVAGANVTFEDVAQLVDGAWVAKCINLGPPSEIVYLALYGTGIHGSSQGLTFTATVNGINVPVLFAGAQGAYAGLDQVNIGPIPRQLIGAGTVNVIVSVNGTPANTVQVCIN
jgi:uncharacterized protein (TIGR03437 family)